MPLSPLDARPLAGTEGAVHPFWFLIAGPSGSSPTEICDRVISLGGALQTLCDAPSNPGGTWGRDGVIILSRAVADGLYRVPATGGTPCPHHGG